MPIILHARHLGDYAPGTVIYGKFTSTDNSSNPTALASSPALAVYKDNSTTESTTGVTFTGGFDSRTGFNHFAVDTSADGTFYAAGSFFDIVLTAGTLGGVSAVGNVVGSFTLNKVSSLRPTTAGNTLDVTATGAAGIDWANVENPTTTLNLSGTSTKALQPTVAGRTLDVAATGEAGLDFNNVLSSSLVTLHSLTVSNATTFTGNVSMAAGLTVTQSTTNGHGISVTGNGTGAGIITTGGASGDGLKAAGGGTAGNGVYAYASSATGNGFRSEATGSGHGVWAYGNGSGNGLFCSVTGAGFSFAAPTMYSSGGFTGNITGNLSGSAGSVTGAVGSVTGNVGGNVVGSVGSVTGLTASNLDATISSRMATYVQPTGFLAATFPATVASTTNITAGTITTATNVTTVNGLAANVITAASLAADAGAEIADAVWDEDLSGHLTAGTAGKALSDAGSAGTPPTASQIAAAVWQDTTAGDFTVASSIGKSLYTAGAAPGAAGGLTIAGSNAATTFATLTSTGAFNINGVSNVAQTGDSYARIGSTGSGLTSLAPAATALSTAVWTAPPTGFLAATFPAAVSDLTQTQVTGGAYALNSASFAFNSAMDFTAAQKAATLARVTLADTLTTYTGNTPQTGDAYALIGAAGAGLTSLAPAATALSTAEWTNTRAGLLDNLDAAVSTRLAPTTAGRTLAVTATGGAGIDWSNVENPTATVGLTNTTVGTLTTYTGNTPQTGDAYARIGATGSGLTSLAPAATALSTAQWTNTRAAYLDELATGVPTVAEIWDRTMTALLAVPDTDASVLEAVEWMFTMMRNKVTQTATTQTVYMDDGVTPLAASTLSDDGTEFERSKFA